MSVEGAIGFYQKMASDADFRNQLESMAKEDVLKAASENGFNFTMEELEDVCEYVEEQGEELDIEALETVVGGLGLGPGILQPIIGPGIPGPLPGFPSQGKNMGWW